MARLLISIDQTYLATDDAAKRRRPRGPAAEAAPSPAPSAVPRRSQIRNWLVDAVSILVIVASVATIYAIR